MSVIHVVPSLHPNGGGPSRTVVKLTDALAKRSIYSIGLITQCIDGEPQVASRCPDVLKFTGHTRNYALAALGISGRQKFVELCDILQPDLVHIHGIWHPLGHWASKISHAHGIKTMIHPRGMLEPWALAWRSWKKKLALLTYQRSDLEASSILFATAEQEAMGFRQLGLRQPIALIPNGVELDSLNKRNFQTKNYKKKKLRRALFLSRIHPKKGLFNLLEAWASIGPIDWELQLAGPDECGHLAEIQQRIAVLGLQSRVQYIGVIDDENKGDVYSASDLFILPSFSENFGVVVAEALSYGLPVIATRGTPWRGLEENGCGWWVDPTVEGLSIALRDAVRRSSSELHEMGVRGELFAHQFNWDCIADQTLSVYQWVLGHAKRPDHVFID